MTAVTHHVDGYLRGKLRLGTWHRGQVSADMELGVFRKRAMRGDFDKVVVTDFRTIPPTRKEYRL